MNRNIAISVVSHGQVALLNKYLPSIVSCPEISELVVTHNVLENELEVEIPAKVKLIVIKNEGKKGFGENHNQAFKETSSEFFCVVNPDIWLLENVFSKLVTVMSKDENFGLLSTIVLDKEGHIQDSFRNFPDILSLLRRRLVRRKPHLSIITQKEEIIRPEWIAGMFMFFRSSLYQQILGFDEKFFLYCEDIDISLKTLRHGFSIGVCSDLSVYHDARRDSSKNLAYLKLHLNSLIRLYTLYPKKAIGI